MRQNQAGYPGGRETTEGPSHGSSSLRLDGGSEETTELAL
jgi:hypothetical protein